MIKMIVDTTKIITLRCPGSAMVLLTSTVDMALFGCKKQFLPGITRILPNDVF